VADGPAQNGHVAVVLGEVGRLGHQDFADEFRVADQVELLVEDVEADERAVGVGQMVEIERRAGDQVAGDAGLLGRARPRSGLPPPQVES